MLSVEGTFENGIVQLNQPVAGRDGQKVIIVFLQEENESPISDSAWNDFAQMLKDCQVHTGIGDLAHQHDHYLHGTPKRED
jgi:predicted DNA-binding antitoxin AbrB/MazE fold protein